MCRVLIIFFGSLLFSLIVYSDEISSDIKSFWRSKLSNLRLHSDIVCQDDKVNNLDDYIVSLNVNNEFLNCIEEKTADKEMKSCELIMGTKYEITNKLLKCESKSSIIIIDVEVDKKNGNIRKKAKFYKNNIEYFFLKKTLLYELDVNKGSDYYYKPVCVNDCLKKAIDKLFVQIENLPKKDMCEKYRIDISFIEGQDFSKIKMIRTNKYEY